MMEDKNKVMDFGEFGKWSLSTLAAQSHIARGNSGVGTKLQLPKAIEDKLKEINNTISDLERERTKVVGEMRTSIKRLDILYKQRKIYEKITKIVVKLLK